MATAINVWGWFWQWQCNILCSLFLFQPLKFAWVLIKKSCFCSAEQYDTFVKFTHDQVERRLAESAFSCESFLLPPSLSPLFPSLPPSHLPPHLSHLPPFLSIPFTCYYIVIMSWMVHVHLCRCLINHTHQMRLRPLQDALDLDLNHSALHNSTTLPHYNIIVYASVCYWW